VDKGNGGFQMISFVITITFNLTNSVGRARKLSVLKSPQEGLSLASGNPAKADIS